MESPRASGWNSSIRKRLTVARGMHNLARDRSRWCLRTRPEAVTRRAGKRHLPKTVRAPLDLAETGKWLMKQAPRSLVVAPAAVERRVLDDRRNLDLRVRAIRDADELKALVPAWRELAVAATTPNPFWEPWMLLPALAHLRDGGDAADVDVVVVEQHDRARPGSAKVLCALAPFERVRRWRGLPVEARVLWRYRHCYLGTPLVRAGCEQKAVAALLDWGAGAAPLLELRGIAADGGLHQALVAELHTSGLESSVSGRHLRALLRRATDAETYFARALSGGRRKELRRQERRLGELGALAWTELGPSEDPGRAIDQVLALEVLGWKGRSGGALALDQGDRAFFETTCRAAHAAGRLLLTALSVDGRPVAAKCSFTAGDGAFAFKIAYDEALARWSPGVLLELDNVRRVHARRDLQWMDSCAAPDHPMIDAVWPDRRPIETVLVAPSGAAGASTMVAGSPLLRRAARAFTGWRGRRRSP